MRYFHEGEARVQAAYGSNTEEYEAMSAQMMRPQLNPSEIEFVSDRTFSVAASVDADGRPWASPLFAVTAPLFDVPDPAGRPDLVTVRRESPVGDPLGENLAATGRLGVLFFDPSRRRRAKSMGTGTAQSDGSIRYEMSREFGLCPKYIYKRDHSPATISVAPTDGDGEVRATLSELDREQLERTDTIFYASFYPGHGADATHRGGAPGFVRVLGPTRLEVPEFFGNGMFNTLGNLVLDDRLGLMTVDHRSGRTIHLTGRATWRDLDRSDPADDALDRRIERLMTIDVDEVVNSTASVGEWTDVEASPSTPALAPS